MKKVLFDLFEQYRIDYQLYSPVVDVEKIGPRVTGVVIAAKEGRVTFRGKTIVDATGDGDVAYLAGCEMATQGDEETGWRPPVTVGWAVCNVDIERFYAWLEKGVELDRHQYQHFNDLIREYREKGYDLPGWVGLNRTTIPGVVSINSGTSLNLRLDCSKSATLTLMEKMALDQAIGFVNFCREKKIPGMERVHLMRTGGFAMARDTRRLIGEYRFDNKDVMEGTDFEDAIASKYGGSDPVGQQRPYTAIKQGAKFPYRSLLPREVDGLLVAGRCSSATMLGHYGGKSMGNMLSIGQGAGVAAAAIAKDLLGIQDQELLYARLMGLGYGLDRQKKTEVAGEIFDELRKGDNLPATILAADVLLRAVMGTSCDGFVPKEGIVDFPQALCERAAALLDHPDPVVQAMAEWMLALRFKKQNHATSYFSDLFRPEDRKKPWFLKWWNRKTDFFLTDDYCRQLVQLDRHRTLEGLKTEVGKIEERMGRLLKAPGSDAAKASLAGPAYRDALADIRAAIAKGNLLAAHQAYPKLRLAAREAIAACRSEFPREGVVFMTNYRIPGGDWNVNMAVTNITNMPCGDIHWKKSADPAAEAVPFGLQKNLGDGSVRGIDLSWEADRILFSYWHQPIDPKIKPHGWDTRKDAFLYELDVADGAIRQLSKSPGDNDIEPCFLPDGGYVFASDRSSFGNQCAGAFIQDKRCTTLYRLDPRRSEKPVAISNNKNFDRHPHILNDGTIIFMHWEYQERDLYNSPTAWRCRPDGTNMDAFYKQHIAIPMSIRDAQQAPDSSLCVATAQGHHDSHRGPVIVFNPSLGINNPKAMQLVTPGVASVEGGLGPLYAQVVPEGGVENRGGTYINHQSLPDVGKGLPRRPRHGRRRPLPDQQGDERVRAILHRRLGESGADPPRQGDELLPAASFAPTQAAHGGGRHGGPQGHVRDGLRRRRLPRLAGRQERYGQVAANQPGPDAARLGRPRRPGVPFQPPALAAGRFHERALRLLDLLPLAHDRVREGRG